MQNSVGLCIPELQRHLEGVAGSVVVNMSAALPHTGRSRKPRNRLGFGEYTRRDSNPQPSVPKADLALLVFVTFPRESRSLPPFSIFASVRTESPQFA